MPFETAATVEVPHLPPSAPKVRITGGMGTLHQKTWVLRRSATLIGCGRQANICLNHPDISKAHCLVVNNGNAVLLKDLNSRGGTRCRDTWVDLVTLSDGDVLRLGETALQIAIQSVEADSGASVADLDYSDPLLLREPLRIRRPDTGESWQLEQAVAVIGRSPGAAVRLDHPDVSLAHAAVFGIGRRLAVLDLDSRTGVWVNGDARSLSMLSGGESLRIGPFELALTHSASVRPGAASRSGLTPELGADAWEALEGLRVELARRGAELDQLAARLNNDQGTVAAARASIEKERAALLRQAAALRETEVALESRRRSLEQREKALRETLLRQAQGPFAPLSLGAPLTVGGDSEGLIPTGLPH